MIYDCYVLDFLGLCLLLPSICRLLSCISPLDLGYRLLYSIQTCLNLDTFELCSKKSVNRETLKGTRWCEGMNCE